MIKQLRLVGFCILFLAVNAVAQTTVTTSGGTSGQVPLFNGASTIGNSVVTQSGSNVGIGTTSPRSALDVYSADGVNHGIRLGAYWEFNNTAYNTQAFWGINAVLTTSNISTSTNLFSPIYNAGSGMVMTENGAGTGNIAFYGIGWNNSSTAQAFPSAFTPVLALQYSGNVGIGTTSPVYTLDVTGTIRATTGIVFPDGTTQTTAFAPALCSSTGADYAEAVDVTGDRTQYEPGDILVIDPSTPGKFLKSTQAYSTLVAGIYSTKPGFVGRKQPASANEIPMAMVGRVPTKVSAENGPIKVGDLLVASSTPGRAMKGTDRSLLTGAVVGKALGSLDSGMGVIEVLVTLQ
jgi:hypothetical protein